MQCLQWIQQSGDDNCDDSKCDESNLDCTNSEDVQSEDAILVQDITILSDPALWTVDETLREKLVRKPISQNIGDFSRSERVGKSQKCYLS